MGDAVPSISRHEYNESQSEDDITSDYYISGEFIAGDRQYRNWQRGRKSAGNGSFSTRVNRGFSLMRRGE